MFDGANDRKPDEDGPLRPDGSPSRPPESAHADISLVDAAYKTSAVAAVPAFAPGDLLAQRFRVNKFIGRGGMGEVYEAEDLELNETVAIKTLLSEIASSPEALDRFKREIQLARKVTHPNVCRTFDLIRHEVKESSSRSGPRSITFLTMEFLHGETLAAALRRKGRFIPAELLPLARQMAEALMAAHRAGIVHQDFKPGNVMLVGSESEPAPRAVVSDFGLAQIISPHPGAAAGGRSGTPDYMSPEQVRGEPVAAAADVFSFGVVLYEAITGRLPFPARTREEAAQKRLREAPLPPSRFVTDVPPDWERVVLRCMARNPKDRYADPRAAIRDLEGTGRRRVMVCAALALAVIIGGAVSWLLLRPRLAPRVAVVSPRNISGKPQDDWLSTEIADTLSTYLEVGTKLQVVPRDDVVRTLDDFSIPANEDLARENIAPFRDAIGASYLVVGGYRTAGDPASDEVHVSLRLQGPRGETLDSFEKAGSVQGAQEISIEAADEFRRVLGQAKAPAQEEDTIYPRDADARRFYFEGLAKLRYFSAGEALESLKLAAAREERNPLIHSAMADALSMLRRDADAAREARMASDLAAQDSSLPQEYALLIKAHAAEMNHQWDSAQELYGSLFVLDPRRLNYGLKLASVQTSASKPAEALQTLDRLMQLPKPLGQDPRISIEKAKALLARADYAGAVEAAKTALSFAIARKARLMQADADIQLCWAYRNLGRADEALHACDDAEKTFSVFGDQAAEAVALNDMGTWLAGGGRYSEAKQDYDRVITIQEKVGAQKDLAGALLNSAKMSIYLGKQDEAELLLRRSIDVSAVIEDKYDQALARIQLADILYGRGDLANSEKEARAARDLAHEMGDRSTEAFAMSALAIAKMENGDLRGSLKDYTEVLAIRQSLDETITIPKVKTRIADVYARMGDITAAERNYKEALALDEQLKSGDAAQDRLSLASLDIQRRHFTGVEESLMATIKTFHEQKDSDSEEDALSILIQLLIEENKLDAAAAYVDEMKRLGSNDVDVKLDAALTEGMFLAASHRSGEALGVLNLATTQAEKFGRHYTALQLDLAIAQAEAESGDRASARKEFSIVRTAALRFGFKTLAEKATALAGPLGR